MMKGVDKNAPVVMDTEDKITALEEEDTPENRAKLVLRTINSLIGECSNASSCFHNKTPKSAEIKQKYESYIDVLSIINGNRFAVVKFREPRPGVQYIVLLTVN